MNDVPTVIEGGLPGFDVTAWFGFVAPAGTPADIIQKVQRDAARVLALPEMRERLGTLGAEPVGSTPEEFAALIKEDIARWAQVVKASGVKLD